MLLLLWVWFCAYLNCAGWALSALHELNAAGYAVALLPGIIALFVWKQKNSKPILPPAFWHKFRRRVRRPFPLAFLILAALAFLGGALHAPNNFDAMAYRLPRVLHWLAANQWHWIHTIYPQINNRSCGIEWVSAPFIAFFKTDRCLFLINIVSFLFLPGLVFSVFTKLGVRLKVAWHWMWIVPTGYCFLLQAGSIANDLFGAIFALAAVDFALRAKISRSPGDFFASLLAAAMMTGAKTSSLPLLLPWAIAFLPSFKLIFHWPLKTPVVCVMAIFASALPTMVFNAKFSGDWSGADLNRPEIKNAILWRTGDNVILTTIQNFVPPFFPLAGKWNEAVEKHVPDPVNLRLHQVMAERGAAEFSLPELQIEEYAGLGFGVSMLLLISFFYATIFGKSAPGQRDRPSIWMICLRWSPPLALLALLTQSNLTTIARFLTPDYALLLPVLLVRAGNEQLVERRWWRFCVLAVFLIAAGLLIISPARPLFPAQAVLEKISMRAPNSKSLARMEKVYSVYHERNDAFAPARNLLPPGVKILGLITDNDPETSLWRPFGSRRVEHVSPDETASYLKTRGIEYVLVNGDAFGNWFPETFAEWLKRMNAYVTEKIPLTLLASGGARDWYLVKLN